MPALPDEFPSSRSPSTGTSDIYRPDRDPVKPLLQVGGGLGLAGVSLGFCILIVCCAGFDAILDFSPAVIILGLADLTLTVIACWQGDSTQNSSTLASLFLAILSIGGGLLEMAVLFRWPIMFNQAS